MSKLLVFTVEKRNGISKKGNAYEMLVAGGLITLEDGSKKPAKVTLFGNSEKPLPDVKENQEYEILTSVSVNYAMEVEVRISGLVKKGA